MILLTVRHDFEQHFHFRQRVEAGEVGPLGGAGLGRLLPASCFCFGQQPVAEAIVRPPAVSALCTNIPPVLCVIKKNPDGKRNESTSISNIDSQMFPLFGSGELWRESSHPQVPGSCGGHIAKGEET